MAMEALEGVLDDAPKVLEASITGGLYEVIQCRDAITAIKAALAQPEQMHIEKNMTLACPSYLHDYTTPPQRKPLSDEEIETYRYMIDWTAHWSYIKFARAIEAAHGIKGEA